MPETVVHFQIRMPPVLHEQLASWAKDDKASLERVDRGHSRKGHRGPRKVGRTRSDRSPLNGSGRDPGQGFDGASRPGSAGVPSSPTGFSYLVSSSANALESAPSTPVCSKAESPIAQSVERAAVNR